MPGKEHISFLIAIEVAIPAWGSLIIDEAIAAPPTVVLAAGTMAACDIALEVALTFCAVTEEIDVVLLLIPFILSLMAVVIVAIIPFNSLT